MRTLRHGPSQATLLPPEGINAVMMDGSARWFTYNDDPARSELEPCLEAWITKPGFVWPKPQ